MGVDAEAGDQGPQGVPDIARDEEVLVAEDVACSASDEDKGPDGEGVAGDEPGELAWIGGTIACAGDVDRAKRLTETCLREELGGARKRDEEGFVEKGEGWVCRCWLVFFRWR